MWTEAYGYRTLPFLWNQNSNPRLPEIGVDRLGFEPRTSCLQSRRSSADLPAPTRAQRRFADETFREGAALASESLCRECDARTWILGRNGPCVGSSA